MLCKQEKPTKNKQNLFKKEKKFKKKEKCDGFADDLCPKGLLLLVEYASFAENKNRMKEVDFDMVCIMIYEGRYFPAEVPPALDNMFYERFGMSCHDVADAVAGH